MSLIGTFEIFFDKLVQYAVHRFAIAFALFPKDSFRTFRYNQAYRVIRFRVISVFHGRRRFTHRTSVRARLKAGCASATAAMKRISLFILTNSFPQDKKYEKIGRAFAFPISLFAIVSGLLLSDIFIRFIRQAIL